MTKILFILLAIVILLLMVVIHELGHYVAGKLLKFKINEFSVGFGPKIISKKKKNGEVVSLRAIPLGGYCAFEGEEEEETKPEDGNKPGQENKQEVFEELNNTSNASTIEAALPKDTPVVKEKGLKFNDHAPWKRIIVFVAGAGFNLISAFIFSFFFILVVGFAVPVVEEVYSNGTVPYSQLQAGDKILSVNGKDINILRTYEELVAKVKTGEKIDVIVEREGKNINLAITKTTIAIEGKDPYDGFGFLSKRDYENANFGSAIAYCVPYTFKLSWLILGTFGQLVTGQIPLTSLSGPIGTVDQIASLSALNWRNILILLPLIASNLAIFNLLPIPALDGSKVVFAVIEWVRGKPVNRKVENVIHLVGIIALFGFVILIDLIGLFT